MRSGRSFVLVFLILSIATIAFAQYRRGGRGRGFRPSVDRTDTPSWETDPRFSKDMFVFVRLKYPDRWGGGWKWQTDYPDSDVNFSWRLHQMTSLKVQPNGKILELTDPELADHPFIYVIEPGAMELTEEEVVALRRYLLNGGFMMVDDFWGEREWQTFYEQIKRVFPDREPTELSVDHPIFSAVFPLTEKPQMASIHHWYSYRGTPYANYERPDAAEVHYKALYDDKGRMMAIICHNTDLGDGWEREGEDPDYFHEFAEKKAYPMGINIIFYAMTH